MHHPVFIQTTNIQSEFVFDGLTKGFPDEKKT